MNEIAATLYDAADRLGTASVRDVQRDGTGQITTVIERRSPEPAAILADVQRYVSTLPSDVHLDTLASVQVLDASARVCAEVSRVRADDRLGEMAGVLEYARDAVTDGGIAPSYLYLGWTGLL